MGVIRIAMPPKNPYCIGRFAAVNMDTDQELGRAAAGETMTLPADSPIDLDIAVVRIGAPAVGLRFQARPGQTYGLYWRTRGFGACLGAEETGPAQPVQRKNLLRPASGHTMEAPNSERTIPMTYAGVGIAPCELLLPAPSVDLTRWACVACDQYTSQPEYWRETAALVGDAPSCLKLVLPECDLPQTARRVPEIHAEMAKYLADGTLETRIADGFVLVERTTESGSRLGLVCAVDLEQYDFTGSKCLVRPTEQTITARLPARLTIRRDAPIELSHILLLMDDPARSVIEPLYARRDALTVLYDFPLMQQGGHLMGWAVTAAEDKAALLDALTALKAAQGPDPLLFAVGDGNHSLATAKVRWEEIKATLSPEAQANHPARYAMVEVENIHDPALRFEPIHRLITGADPQALLADWQAFCVARGMALHTDAPAEGQRITVTFAGREQTVTVTSPDGPIPVATLQTYLDDFLARHGEAQIDYIHGDDVVRRLANAPGAMGFLLPALDKSAFFSAVNTLGILPRKTFSMGHAHEKRFYMECRAIR